MTNTKQTSFHLRLWAGAAALAAIMVPVLLTHAQTTATLYTDGTNFGIGTTGPTQKLQVVGTISATSFSGDGSGLSGISAGGWTDGGTNVYTSTTTDNVGIGTTTPTAALLVENAGTQASFRVNDSVLDGTPFIINESGRIGIGTTNPGFPLHVWDAVNSVNYMTIEETDATGIAGLRVVDGSNIAKIFTYGQSHPTQPNLIQVGSLSGASNDLAFVTGNNAEQMRIRSGGNVGIGTINPVAKIVIENVNAIDSLRVNDITADPSPFVIDQSGNVGIGTSSPVNKLVVSGGVGIGTLTSSTFINTTAPSGGLLVEKNVGIGTTTPVGGLAVMNGNVGIGTWSPTQRLQVIGTVNATAFVGDGSGLTGISAGGWSDGGTNVYTSTTTDNVGIGTTTPSTTLEIVKQGTSAPLMVSSAGTGDGDFLFITSAGSVGIGTVSPNSKLEVFGDVRVGVGTITAPSLSFVGDSDTGFYSHGTNSIGIVTNGNLHARFSSTANLVSVTNSGPSINFGGIAAGTPAFGFLGMNAGIYAPSTEIIGFATNGVERMRIDELGDVGIGTTNTINKLTISGGVAVGGITYAGSVAPSSGMIIQGGVGIGTTTPVAGLAVMNGNVGIGTWSPTAKLQVVGQVSATSFSGDGSGLTGISAGGWTDGGTNVYTSTTTDLVAIGTTTPVSTLTVKGNVGIGTTTPYTTIAAPANGAIIEGNVGIGTFAARSGKLIVMGGSVGVGTVAPSFAIEARGAGNVNGDLGAQYISTSAGGYANNRFVNSNGNDAWIGIGGSSTPEPYSGRAYLASSSGVSLSADGPSADIRFYQNISGTVTEWARFNTSGNFGVGTTDPVGGMAVMNGNVGIGTWSPRARLEVNNTVSFSSIYNNGNSGTSITIDWKVANIQKVTMTGDCTFTFTAPNGIAKVMLQMTQDGSGGHTATWPGTVKWPGGTDPVLTAAAGSVDFVTCLYDGTNYYCTNSLDFQ